MVLSTVPWRTGRSGRAGEAELAPVTAKVKRDRPMRRHGWAAATQDRFMDAVVLLSILLFLAIAVGCGVLVLQATWSQWH